MDYCYLMHYGMGLAAIIESILFFMPRMVNQDLIFQNSHNNVLNRNNFFLLCFIIINYFKNKLLQLKLFLLK